MLDTALLALSLVPVARLPIPGAEIVSFDPPTGRLLVTSGNEVHAMELTAEGLPRGVGFARLGEPGDDVTHVTCDPAGRGFAAACLVPKNFATKIGSIVFIDPLTLREVARVGVGQNPDSCAFTPGGEFLIVANEGQPTVIPPATLVDPPGSISVIDLRRVRSGADLVSLGDASVTTLLLTGEVLDDAMASDAPPRIAPLNRETPALDMEPEYVVAPDNQRAYVTLQENNAVAVVGLDPPRIERIAGLGIVTREMDCSDLDGALHSMWAVSCAPMPDQLAAFTSAGRRVLLMAEEGDTRGEIGKGEASSPLADTARLADLARDRGVDAAGLAPELCDAARLGRLNILADLADGDGNGAVDTVVAPGGRSMSIYDATTFERLGDTGSEVEVALLSMSADDTRSDDRGPEPEGVIVAEIDAHPVAIVSLERPGAVALVDLSNIAAPSLVGLYPSFWEGDLGPEGMCLIRRSSPDSRPLLAVCYEASGTLVIYSFGPTGTGSAK